MLKVLIVKDGRIGEQPKLRTLALSGMLNDEGLVKKAIKVEIVENTKEIMDRMQTEPIHAVIFLTRTKAEIAEKLAAEYPSTRFYIFTGRIPQGKAIWIEREWLNPDFFRSLVSTIDEF